VKASLSILALFTVCLFISPALAETQEELTQQTIEKCAATASTTPTPQMILEKVNSAVDLINKKGDAAFLDFQGKNSDYIFAGTYIWIHSADNGNMLMHPIKYKLNGKNILGLRDGNGKQFFTEMNMVCLDSGDGWVDYVWPKPGEKAPSPKVSYVKLATYNGQKYVVGCGVYDLTTEDVRVALAK
jgi:cytochrome c